MRKALVLVGLVLGLAGGGAAGYFIGSEGQPQATTVTDVETAFETVTETAAAREAGLPDAVVETRDAILAAAESGDYEQLRPLVPEQFSYTFGGPTEGGPIEYWQELAENDGVEPIEILADLLKLPYTLYQGTYTWPFAFDKAADDLAPEDRALLQSVGGDDLSDDFGEGVGYLGWRVGIKPDGTWVFFIAGD